MARGSFLNGILARPQLTGAIAPSSRFLAHSMIAASELSPLDTVLEIGPGTGALTRPILSQLQAPHQYFGIEINPRFVEHLRKHLPQATIAQGSAEELVRLHQDHLPTEHTRKIFASLPWTLFSQKLQSSILQASAQRLAPDGIFVTFIYAHALSLLPRARQFQELLNQNFSDVRKSSFVLLNLPPAVVFAARKPKR